MQYLPTVSNKAEKQCYFSKVIIKYKTINVQYGDKNKNVNLTQGKIHVIRRKPSTKGEL